MSGGGESSTAVASEPEPDEASLWAALGTARGGDARERLFELHLPFARRIASRIYAARTSSDIDFADLRQLACAGLLEAIDGFEPGRGVPFRGYAVRRIKGSILDGISTTSELREQISFRSRVRRERVRSLSDGQETHSPPDALAALAQLAAGLALGFMLEGTGMYVGQNETDPRPSAYQSLLWKDAVRRVRTELDALPEREGRIVRLHYLEGLNFDAIGELLQISKGRVSQLHRASLLLLRKRMARAGDFRVER
jgi:RNA polymerase sigma factor for flagellar operon FliA